MSSSSQAYIHELTGHLDQLDQDAIDKAASLAAKAIMNGGMIQVFGSAHSGLAAMEVSGRASSLSPINALRDPALSAALPDRAGAVERVPGYVSVSLNLWELGQNDVLVVISNSGINAAPNEVAQYGKENGLPVIAITSLEHSKQVEPRTTDGKKLYERADLVLDTGTPAGDWTIEVGAAGLQTGPVSTILAMATLHAMLASVTEILTENDYPVPLIRSLNMPGGNEVNEAVQAPYRSRQVYV